MLEIKKISKIYETEGFKQNALDNFSVNFRENEFASILGPSGSGKTTLLNIIGGLDKYTSGDLIINETSTKKYKDKDWDAYRNHRIGFVFQSYNLIPHQSILSNVELALTLSGISKSERKQKAKAALDKVGLKDHMKKRPNQLSGGQMQRVAIARALVNDPDILLADEPTGALDSETSIQIMNLLTEIAKEKLVIMVTHNEDLAKKYSNRIISLKDGKIVGDTNPYNGKIDTKVKLNNVRKSRKNMNYKTALGLSLNNLLTKKGRTFLTAFAGSIGIIGIALILSLSNGVNTYITKVERETLSSYPIQIEKQTTDISAMMSSFSVPEKVNCNENEICTIDDITNSPAAQIGTSMITNNLVKFKEYLDNTDELDEYITDIKYRYNITMEIYNEDIKVNPNTLSLNPYEDMNRESMETSGITMEAYSNNVFKELIGNENLLKSQYTIIEGKFPETIDELILILDKDNNISLSTMYALNIEDRKNLPEIYENLKDEDYKLKETKYNPKDLIGKEFKILLPTEKYQKENGIWIDKSADQTYLNNVLKDSKTLKIVGVARVSKDAVEATSGYIGYMPALSEEIITKSNNTPIVKQQQSKEKINIFTNMPFDGTYSTLNTNLSALGSSNLDMPSGIDIYPNGFESKEKIEEIINEYNDKQETEDKIQYTDFIGVLLSSVTKAIDTITYVLVAFVAVSLIVSSIMIAIITYISVLERTKEIGILRSIGASKKDVSRVFRAETIIEGFISGILGIFLTIVLNVPINNIVENTLNVTRISILPINGAITLIIISVLLTLIAGLIPAKIASNKDPVECLRSE